MGCAVSDDNAEQLVQPSFREGRTLKSAAFFRFGLPFTPAPPEEIDMTDTTHPFDALMEITARPPVVFVRGDGSYLWDDTRQALSRLRAGLGRQRLGHSPPADRGSACRTGQTAADAEPGLLQRPQPQAGASAGREQLLRSGVLRQFRRGGQRRRDQARAEIRREIQERRVRDHHLRRRLSRPHARHHVGVGQDGVRAAVRAEGLRLQEGQAQRSGIR